MFHVTVHVVIIFHHVSYIVFKLLITKVSFFIHFHTFPPFLPFSSRRLCYESIRCTSVCHAFRVYKTLYCAFFVMLCSCPDAPISPQSSQPSLQSTLIFCLNFFLFFLILLFFIIFCLCNFLLLLLLFR